MLTFHLKLEDIFDEDKLLRKKRVRLGAASQGSCLVTARQAGFWSDEAQIPTLVLGGFWQELVESLEDGPGPAGPVVKLGATNYLVELERGKCGVLHGSIGWV